MTLSLSTMWAQQDRFVADMHLFAQEAAALGYDAIEIAHSTATGPFDRLLSYPGVNISSIHAPAPLVRDGANKPNSSLNLASLDDAERRGPARKRGGEVNPSEITSPPSYASAMSTRRRQPD